MKYLLDTDHVSVQQRPGSAEHLILSNRIDQHPRNDFGVSVVTFHEQVLGAHNYLNRARRPADLLRGYALLLEILDHFAGAAVVPFDAAAMSVADQLRALKPRMATMDLRIAATAVSRGLTLLTRNRSHFAGVPGLVVQDWTV